MIENISAEEIKTKYRQNHGFAFISAQRVSDEAAYRLADTLIKANITSKQPLVITRYEQSVIFIYDDFEGPTFFAKAQFFEQTFGIARVVPFMQYVNSFSNHKG
jgi:hypothetical protein